MIQRQSSVALPLIRTQETRQLDQELSRRKALSFSRFEIMSPEGGAKRFKRIIPVSNVSMFKGVSPHGRQCVRYREP
jgi:hypothetical protein